MRLISLPFLATLCLTAAALPCAKAQVGLRNEYRLVSVSAPSELRVDTGLINSSSPLVNADTNSGTYEGAFTLSSINVSTYYGNMSITGSGQATNSHARGAFAWIDTPIGGDPISRYQDLLHVNSSTLAAGTDVTIGFTESFSVTHSETDPLNGANPSFRDYLWINNNNGADQWTVNLTNTGSASYLFHAKVGDTLNVHGELHANDSADSNTLYPIVNSSFSFSASGPLYVTSVSDGVSLTADSGATYRPSSVPDTGSTLLLLGLALGALVVMHRRQVAA